MWFFVVPKLNTSLHTKGKDQSQETKAIERRKALPFVAHVCRADNYRPDVCFPLELQRSLGRRGFSHTAPHQAGESCPRSYQFNIQTLEET